MTFTTVILLSAAVAILIALVGNHATASGVASVEGAARMADPTQTALFTMETDVITIAAATAVVVMVAAEVAIDE